jgi:hypothetical protein
MTLRCLVLLLMSFQICLANVEKAIFLAPETVNVPLQHPTLDDLHIDVLTPEFSTLRTQIEAAFPDDISKTGKTSWFLLDKLNEGQRYEVRICWASTVRARPLTCGGVQVHKLT